MDIYRLINSIDSLYYLYGINDYVTQCHNIATKNPIIFKQILTYIWCASKYDMLRNKIQNSKKNDLLAQSGFSIDNINNVIYSISDEYTLEEHAVKHQDANLFKLLMERPITFFSNSDSDSEETSKIENSESDEIITATIVPDVEYIVNFITGCDIDFSMLQMDFVLKHAYIFWNISVDMIYKKIVDQVKSSEIYASNHNYRLLVRFIGEIPLNDRNNDDSDSENDDSENDDSDMDIISDRD